MGNPYDIADDDPEYVELLKRYGVGQAAPQQEKSGLTRRLVGDTAVSALKGAIGLPEAVVGLADYPTAGYAGKAAEAVGFRPREAKEFLDTMYSPEQQAANQRVREAKGFFGKAGAMLENPSTIGHGIVETLPATFGGGIAAQGFKRLGAGAMGAGGMGPAAPGYLGRALGPTGANIAAGALGEGAVGMGMAAEQMRQQSPDGTLGFGQLGSGVASGLGTAAFGAMGGKFANKMGLDDIDTMLARGTLSRSGSALNAAKSIGGGMFTEGALEEMPQSMWEQAMHNVGTGRPFMEGVPEAGGQGLVLGAAMGGGFNAASYLGRRPPGERRMPETEPTNLLQPTTQQQLELPFEQADIEGNDVITRGAFNPFNRAGTVSDLNAGNPYSLGTAQGDLFEQQGEIEYYNPSQEAAADWANQIQAQSLRAAIKANNLRLDGDEAGADYWQAQSEKLAKQANEVGKTFLKGVKAARTVKAKGAAPSVTATPLLQEEESEGGIAFNAVLDDDAKRNSYLVTPKGKMQTWVRAMLDKFEMEPDTDLIARRQHLQKKEDDGKPTKHGHWQIPVIDEMLRNRGIDVANIAPAPVAGKGAAAAKADAKAPSAVTSIDPATYAAQTGAAPTIRPITPNLGMPTREESAADMAANPGDYGPSQMTTPTDMLGGSNLPATVSTPAGPGLAPVPVSTEPSLPAEVKLPQVQQKVFDHIINAMQNDTIGAVVDAQGVFMIADIGRALNMKPGSVKMALKAIQPHLSKAMGAGSVAEVRGAMQQGGRNVEESDATTLGLAPKEQRTNAISQEDLFGGGEESAVMQGMGIVSGPGGSQANIFDGDEVKVPDHWLEPTEADKARDAKRAEEAKVNAVKGLIDDVRQKVKRAPEAMSTWNEYAESTTPLGTPFHELAERTMALWLLEYDQLINDYGHLPWSLLEPKIAALYNDYATDTWVNQNEQGKVEATGRVRQTENLLPGRTAGTQGAAPESQVAAPEPAKAPAEQVAAEPAPAEVLDDDIKDLWNEATAPLGTLTFDQLPDDLRNYMLQGARTEDALNKRAQEVLDTLMSEAAAMAGDLGATTEPEPAVVEPVAEKPAKAAKAVAESKKRSKKTKAEPAPAPEPVVEATKPEPKRVRVTKSDELKAAEAKKQAGAVVTEITKRAYTNEAENRAQDQAEALAGIIAEVVNGNTERLEEGRALAGMQPDGSWRNPANGMLMKTLANVRNAKTANPKTIPELLALLETEVTATKAEDGKVTKRMRVKKDDITPQAQKIRAAPSANVQRLGKMLGAKLYGTPDDIAKVSVKELFQNGFDAIKESLEKGQTSKGSLQVVIGRNDRSVQIIDNGPGMPPSVMGGQFLQIAGTVKGTKRASGGLGVAKMLFLFENKALEVVSMRDGKVYRLSTTGDELKAAMAANPTTLLEQMKDFLSEDDITIIKPLIEASVARMRESGVEIPEVHIEQLEDPAEIAKIKDELFPDGHGTSVKVTIPDSYDDPTTGETKKIPFDAWGLQRAPVLKYSPLFGNIDVTVDAGWGKSGIDQLDLGTKFPIDAYTPFANVKFDWGTARIYVSKDVVTEGQWDGNVHVLSNGLWQFSDNFKDRPGWDGKQIKRTFYVDVSPAESVKPEDPGYPFDLNRQRFSPAAAPGFDQISKYITVLYSQADLAGGITNFGVVQYVEPDGTLTQAEMLEPSVPTSETAFTAIKPNDVVEVRDGVLYVNNRALPEITPADLANTSIRIDELTIPQDKIDSSKVMVHDNTVDGGSGKSMSDMAREKFGKRFDTYIRGVGEVFHDLRNALADYPGYEGLLEQAFGTSLDIEYYGVSTIVPFKAMFINPATVAVPTNPKTISLSMIGTMLHELAHFNERSHGAGFASEMQRIIVTLESADNINLQATKGKLAQHIANNKDIFDFLHKEFTSGNFKARGNRLKDSANQARDVGSAGAVASAGAARGADGVRGRPAADNQNRGQLADRQGRGAETAGAGKTRGIAAADSGTTVRRSVRAGVKNPSVKGKVEGKLKKLFFNPDRFDSVITVVQSFGELPSRVQQLAGASNVAGVVMDEHVYLVADNIPKGQEFSTLLHELGGHLGLPKLLGPSNYARLVKQVRAWAERNDDRLETVLAKRALARIDHANGQVVAAGGEAMTEAEADEEAIAYFIEESVRVGIDPTALKGASPIYQWFRTLWAAAKSALRKIGLNRFDALTAQNIVDMAYGAAKLEITGAWHGTGAEFRTFNHDYMGSGEGAQAYGWGTYLAQRQGIAFGYWAADVARRSNRRDRVGEGSMMRVDVNVHDNEFLDWDKPLAEQGSAVQKFIKDVIDPHSLAGKYFPNDVVDVETMDTMYHAGEKITAAKIDRMLDAGMDEIVWSETPGSQPYAFNASIWTTMRHYKPKGSSASGGKMLYSGIAFHLYMYSGQSDVYKYTTKDQYGRVNGLTSEGWGKAYKPASEFMDSRGVKGIRFLDQPSRKSVQAAADKPTAHAEYVGTAMELPLLTQNIERFHGDFDMAVSVTREHIERRKKDPSMSTYDIPQLDATLARLDAFKPSDYKITYDPVPPAPDQKELTRNIVVFNDKNLHRIATEVGADRDRIKFSIAAANDAVKTGFENQKAGAIAQLKEGANRALHLVAFTRDLVDIAHNEGLTTARNYYRLSNMRDAEQTRIESEVDRILTEAYKLSKGDRKNAQDFIKKSTIEQKWGFTPSWKKDAVFDLDMAEEFAALSDEAQAVVKDLFRHADTMHKQLQAQINAEIDREYDKRVKAALDAGKPEKAADIERDRKRALTVVGRKLPEMQGPYAPLKRFGNHVFVGKSQRYLDAERDGDKKELARLIKLRGGDYEVTFFDTKYQATVYERENRGRFAPNGTDVFGRQMGYDKFKEVPWGEILKIKTAIEAETGELKGKNEMQRLITDLYISMLSDASARKTELRREGIAGASDEMFRAFATKGRADAHFFAALKHNGDIQRSITDMRNQTRGDPTQPIEPDVRARRGRVFDEIIKRHEQQLNYTLTPFADNAMRFTSWWMLLTSPGYYIQNALQPGMLTLPVLAGSLIPNTSQRVGIKAAANALSRAYGKGLAKAVLTAGNTLDTDSLEKRGLITPAERRMLDTLIEQGKVDITIAQDLGRAAAGEGFMDNMPYVGPGLRAIQNSAQRLEMLNRVVTALAAFRLTGSTDFAGKVIEDSHGNYTMSNAPRWMQGNSFARLVTQFRKFQLIQLSLLGRQVATIMHSAKPEEKAAAWATLRWIATTHGLMAGTLGLPVVSQALALLAPLFGLGGGDDEPKDVEGKLRKAIGNEDVSNLLLRGVPAALGLNMSGKVGMGNTFSVFPFLDTTGQAGYEKALVGMGGATVATGLNMVKGADLIRDGEYYKGLELMLPKGVRDGMRAGRFANEGITNRRGDVLMTPEELSWFDVGTQAIGLPDTKLQERQRIVGQSIEYDTFYKDRTTNLRNAYAKAYRAGDQETLTELRGDWMDMSKAMRANGLKPPPLSSLIKAPMEQRKRERNVVDGVPYTARTKGLVTEATGL